MATKRKPVPAMEELIVTPRKKNPLNSDTQSHNKGEEMTKAEEPTVVEEPKPSKFERIKPIAKKVLIWTGVAAGFVLGAVLLAKTFETSEEIAELEEKLPDNVTELKPAA
jgi:hypothetical protein